MGRTQHTYRMRLQQIRNRYQRLQYSKTYHEIWEAVHNLSAPASTLPYPDTHAVASFCMILELFARINSLKDDIDKIKH